MDSAGGAEAPKAPPPPTKSATENSIWYLINDEYVIGLSCNKKLTWFDSVKLE